MQKSMDYLLNLQYAGKSKTSFDIRLNNHRKGVGNPKAILVCVHSRKEGHNVIEHGNFTLIEQ